MPGAYTHMTMANLAAERRALERLPGFPPEAIRACGRWLKFCELGAVSPDYPYLEIGNSRAKRWADLMHYMRTDGVIRAAIQRLRALRGDAFDKGLAWLLGYTAHVVMDVTIHPVVNLRVGPYEENQTAHRVCEMNQDVYVFFGRMGLELRLAEHIDNGLGACSDPDGGLDRDIRALWTAALTDAYPEEAASNAPAPDAWHFCFRHVVDAIEHGGWLSAMSRHIARDIGLVYPRREALDMTYIEKLPTPLGGTIHFDALFDQARENVHRVWTVVAAGALGRDDRYTTALADWNLDTGKDPSGRLVFWEAGA